MPRADDEPVGRGRKAIERISEVLPRLCDEDSDPRHVTPPTDGTLYEAELAHCSSCEPLREAHLRIELEEAQLRVRRVCLETELLALELEHRRRASLTSAAGIAGQETPGTGGAQT